MISRIQYITQGTTAEQILAEVEEVVEAGIDWVQLRLKDDALDHESIARSVKDICGDKVVFIINDKVELAKMVGANGVHLGLKDMPINEARKMLGSEMIIGGTANTMADCLNHERAGADYVGMGPFAYTETKKELSPIIGLEGFRNLFPKENSYGWQVLSLNIPVVAIGGLQGADIRNLKEQTTLHGVAVSGLIARAVNKQTTVDDLKQSIYGHLEDRR